MKRFSKWLRNWIEQRTIEDDDYIGRARAEYARAKYLDDAEAGAWSEFLWSFVSDPYYHSMDVAMEDLTVFEGGRYNEDVHDLTWDRDLRHIGRTQIEAMKESVLAAQIDRR